VLGATVTVELSDDLAGVTPIWRGHLVPVGQIGSLVRIPQGPVSLLASVTLVGIAELTKPPPPASTSQQGDRWLQVQLLGEVDALGTFRRGVSTYPGLDDSVHFATADDLAAAFPPADESRAGVGSLASNLDVPATLRVDALVTRHSAIVGSTGSGETSAVATLLQSLIEGGWSSANIIVIDPHGEYAAALGRSAAVRSVLDSGEGQLRVPYWALPASELLSVLCSVEGRTIVDRVNELVAEARRTFAAAADWIDLSPEEATADTPVPYDLRNVWYQLDFANRETIASKPNGEVRLLAEGNAEELIPATFEPYGPGGAAPFKGNTYGHYSPAAERLQNRLNDPRFQFFLRTPRTDEGDPLLEDVRNWVGGASPVCVLDFSGVDSAVADVAIGIVLDILFELATHSTNSDGIGRGRPVLIVLEEAHRYLSEGRSTSLARKAVNRIAREGRKYGVGVCLVSQRPSELPDTALSQCGTILALRLTNTQDQATVRAALPDAVAGLASVLPSLRTGEALMSGEAVVLPVRAVLRAPHPPPQASDPTLAGWRQQDSLDPDLEEAVRRWRGAAGGSIG
jgi:hypothetical protein